MMHQAKALHSQIEKLGVNAAWQLQAGGEVVVKGLFVSATSLIAASAKNRDHFGNVQVSSDHAALILPVEHLPGGEGDKVITQAGSWLVLQIKKDAIQAYIPLQPWQDKEPNWR